MLVMLWLMLSHQKGSASIEQLLQDHVTALPVAFNTSMMEHSADFQRLYTALVQNRVRNSAQAPAALCKSYNGTLPGTRAGGTFFWRTGH